MLLFEQLLFLYIQYEHNFEAFCLVLLGSLSTFLVSLLLQNELESTLHSFLRILFKIMHTSTGHVYRICHVVVRQVVYNTIDFPFCSLYHNTSASQIMGNNRVHKFISPFFIFLSQLNQSNEDLVCSTRYVKSFLERRIPS